MSKKGSAWEREFCTLLSTWWTGGTRDDVFWRSSQSGGRATSRFKKGRRTAGSYGDICALDPIGQPLLDFVTIEAKRGYTASTLHDILDSPGRTQQKWESWMDQAQRSAEQAGSISWLIVARRDKRKAIVVMPAETVRRIMGYATMNTLFIRFSAGKEIYAVTLDAFFAEVSPKMIRELLP